MNSKKYTKNYFMPPKIDMSWTAKQFPDKAPVWCSVDLRDGNQALVIPMSLDEKIEFYKMLIQIGFKEIEVGFPAASETEYEFLRTLIEKDLIPDDVTVQVLTQAREHIIKRTFEALDGVKNAIVHVYNSTSVPQREQVFKKSKEDIKKIAVNGALMLKELTEQAGRDYRFEYSPESFTGTEIDYACDVCNAVLTIWKPSQQRKAIINLPSTVQMSMPHIYAAQIAYMSDHLNYRNNIILSLHPHNDRGTGVADSEMGLLAGADRIEGTLFGNGERTGNADIVTIAMNMMALGVDPRLNFSNMPEIVKLYQQVTRMRVYERQPYSGNLVFAAFSGSHQDAIAKGMKWQEEHQPEHWTVPYLLIDPKDIGRKYDGDVIRINSQSGKGGVAYIMEQKYGLDMPKKMRENFGYCVKNVSDHRHKELLPDEIYKIFQDTYVNIETPVSLIDFKLNKTADSMRKGFVHLYINKCEKKLGAYGNGRLDAVSNALQEELKINYTDLIYSEHAMEIGSTSRAMAYIGITDKDSTVYWGAGMDTDIITASVKALISAVNKLPDIKKLCNNKI
ncbi:2-isopropylmalate synthase [Pectinatus sottacetonis]|uniref:2-isopropylmalate synthase n=1 Tax=Pectinatus sottacetonis TaxID=1002795 RepID=UPI0018C507C4|nr:2-isopropylmalate synthase [Pectinatus sottacetonis]